MPSAICGHAIPYGSVGIRGNCRRCYSMLVRLIKQGKTTWEQLESEGKASPLAVAHHPLNGYKPQWTRPEHKKK